MPILTGGLGDADPGGRQEVAEARRGRVGRTVAVGDAVAPDERAERALDLGVGRVVGLVAAAALVEERVVGDDRAVDASSRGR